MTNEIFYTDNIEFENKDGLTGIEVIETRRPIEDNDPNNYKKWVTTQNRYFITEYRG